MKKVSIRRIVSQLLNKKEKKRFLFGLLLVFVSIVLEVFSVSMVIPLLSVLSKPSSFAKDENALGFIADMDQQTLVIGMMILITVIFVVKNVLQVFIIWYQQGFISKLDTRLSALLFANYMGREYDKHLLINSSVLIRNVQAVSLISSGYLNPIMNLLSDSATAIGMFAILLYLEPQGTLVSLGFFAISGFMFQKKTKRLFANWGEERLVHESVALKNLQYGFGGFKDIKVLGREEKFLNSFKKEFSDAMELEKKFNTLSAAPRGFLEIISITGLSGLIISMVLSDRPIIDIVPVVGLFTATAFRLMPAITRIINNFGFLRYSIGSIGSFAEDLSMTESSIESNRVGNFNESLQFDHVQFSYSASENIILKGISFEIRKGESVGFIGESGSGKSTLVDLMIGLLRPTSGQILIDGLNADLGIRSWMDQIGYVPQSIFLTDETIKQNVAFGLELSEIDQSRINEVMAKAQLSKFIETLPEGLDTCVGELGSRISGGERQRIGIARALYRNPKILIFDEATSSLDNETEIEITELIRELGSTCTVVTVAHRYSTLRNCDRIFRIDDGVITHVGTYEEVIGR